MECLVVVAGLLAFGALVVWTLGRAKPAKLPTAAPPKPEPAEPVARYCTKCGVLVESPASCTSEALLALRPSDFDAETGKRWFLMQEEYGGLVAARCEKSQHYIALVAGGISFKSLGRLASYQYVVDTDYSRPSIKILAPPLREGNLLALGPCGEVICPHCNEPYP